jgi:hypothetical protein
MPSAHDGCASGGRRGTARRPPLLAESGWDRCGLSRGCERCAARMGRRRGRRDGSVWSAPTCPSCACPVEERRSCPLAAGAGSAGFPCLSLRAPCDGWTGSPGAAASPVVVERSVGTRRGQGRDGVAGVAAVVSRIPARPPRWGVVRRASRGGAPSGGGAGTGGRWCGLRRLTPCPPLVGQRPWR